MGFVFYVILIIIVISSTSIVMHNPIDKDGDGIPNTSDNCIDKAEIFNGYLDEDGCPDTLPDDDGDGFPNVSDTCPSEPEIFNGYLDEDGCPDSTPPTSVNVTVPTTGPSLVKVSISPGSSVPG